MACQRPKSNSVPVNTVNRVVTRQAFASCSFELRNEPGDWQVPIRRTGLYEEKVGGDEFAKRTKAEYRVFGDFLHTLRALS